MKIRGWLIVAGAALGVAVLAGVSFFGGRQTHEVAGSSTTAPPPATRPPLAPVAAVIPPPDLAHIRYDRLIVDTSHDQAEACVRFTAELDQRPETHYADYLKIEPAAKLAIRVTKRELCLGGLSFQKSYTLTIAAGLPAASNARTEKAETVPLQLGERPRMVGFTGQGFILPRLDSAGVTVETINVDRVKIRVLRMSDRLLPSQMRAEYQAALNKQQFTRASIRNYLKADATLVWSGAMAVEKAHNQLVKTSFPLTDVLKERKPGAYLIVAENAATAVSDHEAKEDDDGDTEWDPTDWDQVATQWVIDTDIALTSMTGDDGLHVFARSLSTAKAMSGVELDLVAVGQDHLGSAKTDKDGQVVFGPGLLRGKGAAAAQTVLAYGSSNDFAVLNLTRPSFDLSDRGVTGRAAPGAVDAYLYTDRGIYRPGETVQLVTLLRDRVGRSIDTMPVTIVLRRPDGLEYRRFPLSAGQTGGFHLPIPISAAASRELWSAEALVDAGGSAVGRVEFDVDDFVPQRLKVTLDNTLKVLHPADTLDLGFDGQFLYGAPAAGLNGEAEIKISADAAPFANYKAYRFGLVDETFKDVAGPLEMGASDGSGKSRVTGSPPNIDKTSLPLKATISAGLFEPGGRLTKDQITVPFRTHAVLLGIKPRFGDDRVNEGSDAVVDVLAFDDAGAPVPLKGLRYRFIYEQRSYDWYYQGSRWDYHYSVIDQPIRSGTVDIDGKAPATLSQNTNWGYYRLEVEDPVTGAMSSVRFHAGWQSTAESADTPDKVQVEIDRANYAVGDTTRVKIKPPFAGEVQVTVATDRIFEVRNITVPAEGATIDIKTSADWGVGAYVLASLYRPLSDRASHQPVRAVGLAWIPLDMAPRTLGVEMTMPDKIVPRQTIELPIKVSNVKSGEATFITVAAVDEGILQLTRFASPAPDAYLYGRRRLAIDIRDDYGKLLEGNGGPVGAVREGGDAIGGKGLPVVPTKSVALFSGLVKLAADGTAKIKLDVPDFEGQLRLMAVAYGQSTIGKGEGHLIVRDPVIADVIFPRFLAPGDKAKLTLQLHNTDGAAGAYHLAMTATGAATITADHALDYTLAEGERKGDTVSIAGNEEGIATVGADLTGPNGYKVHHEWGITVRSPNYPLALEQTVLQAKGEAFTLDPKKLDPFVAGSVQVSVGYSRLAGIDVPGLLQSLYRYPYGCTEQLASTTAPLIYYNDEALLGRVPRDAGLPARVQSAIDTIVQRQDATGEFGLWRVGDQEASAWLNLYVLEFLGRAREAGYQASSDTINLSYAWVKTQLRGFDNEYQRNPLGVGETRAYAYYLLAKAGRIEIGDVRYLHDTLVSTAPAGTAAKTFAVSWGGSDQKEAATPLALGHLAGALAILGDKARAEDTFRLAIEQINVHRWSNWWGWWSYWTELRDIAGLISIAAEINDLPKAAALVDRLKSLRLDSDHLSTQEKAQLLAAAHALSKGDAALALLVNGKPAENLRPPADFAPSVDEIKSGFTVTNNSDKDLFRTVVIRGAPKVTPSAMAAGLTIEKRYFTLTGQTADPATVHQNDRLIISLEGHSEDGEQHRLVIADMLPAGWEIESPVRKDEEFDFLDKLTHTQIKEARDDRFVAAFTLNAPDRFRDDSDDDDHDRNKVIKKLAPHVFHVAYIVRAITPGSFALPAAVVEDMYRPGVMARTGGGTTKVEPHS
jgi:uncharacterized protein YfaS (alpha-2-macroglobulin family)